MMVGMFKEISLLQRADRAYHEDKSEILSDVEYDRLKRIARKKNPQHSYFTKVGSPVKHGLKIQLPSPMGSLNELRPREVEAWIAKVGQQPGSFQQFFISPKLDGISLELHYKNGQLYKAYERGDGITGRDVTSNAGYLQGVLPRLRGNTHPLFAWLSRGEVLIKGEAIVHRSIFLEKYKDKKQPNGKLYSAARNFVGGLLNTKPKDKNSSTILHRSLNHCTFVAFGVGRLIATIDNPKKEVRPKNKFHEINTLSVLGFTPITCPQRYAENQQGFKQQIKEGKYPKRFEKFLPIWPEHPKLKVIFDRKEITAELLKNTLQNNLKSLDIAQDGLVITPIYVTWAKKHLGYEPNGITPRFEKSIKLEPHEQVSLIGKTDQIEWEVSKLGVVKPVLVLEKALDFDGVDVKRMSLNNAIHVVRNNIKPGKLVKVIRSGDVIPRLISIKQGDEWIPITLKAGPVNHYVWSKGLPTKCPSCQHSLRWTAQKSDDNSLFETNVDLVCDNQKCPGRRDRRLLSFFTTLGIDGIQEGTIAQLQTAGYNTLIKILSADSEDLRKIEGFSFRKSENLVNEIEDKMQNIPLATLAHASSIFAIDTVSLGSKRLQQIIAASSEKMFLTASVERLRTKLAGVSGIGPVTLEIFLTKIENFRKFYTRLEKWITLAAPQETVDLKMENVVACFTQFRDPALEKLITSHGGKVSSSLSGKTTVLFSAGIGSAKYKKAEDLGILIVDESLAYEWLEKILRISRLNQ